MKLTHCPIDHSPIRRDRDGLITCGGPLVGGHSEAHMVHAYMEQHDLLPKGKPSLALQVGDPCPKCGATLQKNRANLGYCVPCARTARGLSPHRFGMKFSLTSRPDAMYYYEGRTTR